MKKIIRKVVLAMSIPLAISLISCENPSGSSGNSSSEKSSEKKNDNPSGSTTDKPAEGTTTKPSEGTTPEQSQSGGETTKPEQGQDQPGGETTKPEEGQSGGETTKPEEGQSGGETTKPEEGQSGGETTKPEQGQDQPGGETTKPEQGQDQPGGETTKPEQGQDQSGGSSEIPQVTKYTVTFDRDDGTTVVSREIESGKTVTQPEAPTRAGFVFKGWYSGNTKYEFTTPVTGTLTLKAKWAESGIFSSEGAFFIYIDESADPSSLGTAW